MTPRCFAAWSKGKSQAAERDAEDMAALSWLTGARTAEGMSGKLKKFSHYLPRRPAKAQTPAEMLEALREFQFRGAKMNFKKLN